MEPIKIRFYDNDVEKFKGIQISFGRDKPTYIETIAVDELEPNPLIKAVVEADPRYQRDNRSLAGLSTASKTSYFGKYCDKYLREFLTLRPLFFDRYGRPISDYITERERPNRGMTDEQMDELVQWCAKNRGVQKIVFFDWDRTLSVLEGFLPLPRANPSMPWSSEQLRMAYVKYILGGGERAQKLVQLFKFLNTMNVGVFILTNNVIAREASPAQRQIFLDFIHYIDPSFQDDHLLCSADIATTTQKSNKVLLLQGSRASWQRGGRGGGGGGGDGGGGGGGGGGSLTSALGLARLP